MQDWDARLLEEANAKKDLLPKFVPLPPLINLTKEWGTSSKVILAILVLNLNYCLPCMLSPVHIDMENIVHISKYI